MKTILLKLTIVLLSVCFSQTIIAQKITEGEYLKRDKLDKFVGTWEWQSGGEVFRIVLSKQNPTNIELARFFMFNTLILLLVGFVMS